MRQISPLFWYRDYDDKKIDLLIEQDGKLFPVEIKVTANPNKSMIKNFGLLKNQGNRALICMRSTDIPLTENVNAIPVGYI